MKKIHLFVLIYAHTVLVFSQNTAVKLINYQPAPGQHINVEHVGTPQAAINMVENDDDFVSLGAFGGNIILGFNEPCENDPQNPYGVDFMLLGNAFSGASEAGNRLCHER